MELVLDIGNFRIKGAFFQEGVVADVFVIPCRMEELKIKLQGRSVERSLISSVNDPTEKEVRALFQSLKMPYQLLDYSKVKVILDVEEPAAVGHDRIANVYGALFRFPQNDCIVVDIGTAVTFDLLTREGRYLGGAIYPGMEIGAKGLAAFTSKLPEVPAIRPSSPLGKTTITHIQSGLYWGLLGAIERLVSELRQAAPNPTSIKVIATGGATRTGERCPSNDYFLKDLSDLVDLIDPQLTLIGLHEILKEFKHVKS